MNFFNELKTHGIVIPKDHQIPSKFQVDCPQTYCKKQRTADNKNPLGVAIEDAGYAEWRCAHCLWSGKLGERAQTPDEQTSVTAPSERLPSAPSSLPEDAVAFLAAKGVTEETAIKYRLSYDGRRKAIKIPYIEGQSVINHALIRIGDGKSSMERPEVATFYGLDRLLRNSEPVTMAQNELEAIILMERGIPNVIGLPNGGDVIDKADDFNKEPDHFGYLSRASEAAKGWHPVRFAFDDTKRGLSLRQELARRLGPGRCLAAKFSKGSVTATFIELGSEVLCEDINDAKNLPISGLYAVDDFERELTAYYEYGMNSGVTTGWPNVDKIYTVVPGQLTVITGIPNSGKSEWLDALAINLALQFGWRFAAFSPENGKEAHVTKLVEKRVEMSADPKSRYRMSYETMMSGAKWVGNHFFFIESTETMPTLDWILEKAKDATMRYGIKGLIIDPWNRIEKKLGDKSETDYVGESIPKILRFAANSGVHVWLVVHPKQQMKDKNGNIPPPSLYDMAGSAHFVNMCDNGIVIHRAESVDDTTEVLVRKVRFKHVGRRGQTKLRYNRMTGRYEPLDEEATPDQLKAADKYAAASNGDEEGIRTWEVE